MHIAVIGGTRGVGYRVIEQALAAGHTVTALARNPDKLKPLAHPDLHVVVGNVLQPDDVMQVVTGADVVINSLGSTADNPDTVCTDGTRVIIDAMHTAGVKRLITVTALGVGDSMDQVPLAFKLIIKTALRKAYADKNEQEKLIQQSDLDWITVRPGGLTDAPATGRYRVGKSATAGQISRADVAAFVLQQLTDNTYLRQAVAIS